MHKFNLFFIMLFTGLLVIGCGNSRQSEEAEVSEEKDAPEESTTSGATYAVNMNKSKIKWEGAKKFTNTSHNGVINLKSGSFKVENGSIKAGNFVIDMTSIQNTDLEGSPEDQKKLVGHLKSEDFFHVEKYPEAKFELTGVEALSNDTAHTHKINGNLSLKDVTKNIGFPATVNMEDGQFTAKAEFNINRADFNVKYGSETFSPELVQDKIIKDKIHLNIKLHAERESS